jgi:hypothetical protein
MIRYIGMILVVWGLITQPLMAAMPMAIDKHSDTEVLLGIATISDALMLNQRNLPEDGAGRAEDLLTTPCLQTTANDSSANCDHCDSSHCESDCLSSRLCSSSSCISAGISAAAIQQYSTHFAGRNHSIFLSADFQALTFESPSRIFHPPK